MAIKANASSQGESNFKRYVGVASFRVLGVNPTKDELEKFLGREMQTEPQYITDAVDTMDNDKPYKRMRISFMIQADLKYEDGSPIKENAKLSEPLKTTINFFIDSRYFYNRDKSKIQVIDKYGRTAWVTVEQCKNHQIPVYKNGPARLDADYRPCLRGEEKLTQFILNYLNVTPIERWNKNTQTWIVNQHPEDCEGNLTNIKNYFKGDISELKGYCSLMPSNRVKLLVGVRTDNEGKQFNTVYTNRSLRNGSISYTVLKDDIAGNQSAQDTVFTNDPSGNITNIDVYQESVKETDLSKPVEQDPFAQAAALPEDEMPFGEDNPFA
jgi:hypothetical protein